MFQALSQGAIVSIFYRNEPRIVNGKVLSVNTHAPSYNPSQPLAIMNGPVTDITVQVGNETIPFAGLPANGVMADFPAKGMFLSIDDTAAYRELDSAIGALEQDLATVPAKEKLLGSYKSLRDEKNPQAQREKEIQAMRGELAEMKRMLSSMLGTKPKEDL